MFLRYLLAPQLRLSIDPAMKRIFASVATLALLTGCKTVGPDFQRPAAASGTLYSAAANTSAKGPVATLGEGPQARWWEAFESAELNTLVARALAGNQSLAASMATLERAREAVKAANGRLQPQVNVNGQVEHQKLNLNAFGFDASTFGIAIDSPAFTLYSVGGGISYDLDLFGGNHRALEQSTADAEAQLHESEAAHLTLAGRAVMQALMIAALNDRITAQQSLVSEDERNVTLTERKQQGGAGTLVEVLTARQQLANDRAGLPQLDQQRTEARNLLAILLGTTPGELGPTNLSLAAITLPSQVPVTLASELVHKRPDILAAESRLHAATAAIGVAQARLYPSISLGASFSQMATHPEDIFKGSANSFALLGGVTAPIFHGGTLTAAKRGAEAEAKASTARYRQTVLEAFGQVSDLLSALDNDSRSLALQNDAAAIAERSLGLSRRSFAVGNSGVLQVIEASRSVERTRIALVDARARQYINVARLYVATAGGWTDAQP
jgi:NodT family efflux transporter outer membrane factor (OMF) lipoprotein